MLSMKGLLKVKLSLILAEPNKRRNHCLKPGLLFAYQVRILYFKENDERTKYFCKFIGQNAERAEPA